jgi:carbonic anhydrase
VEDPVRSLPSRNLLALCAAATFVLAGCGGGDDEAGVSAPSVSATDESPDDAPDAVEDDGAQQEVEFGYSGANGPAQWASLDEEWAACADATAQSPIDLTGATSASLPDLEFHYATGPLELENNTHTVLATETPGSSVTVDGHEYDLVQFHFHEGSEHTVDGRRYAGELHLVHTDADGATAVVGVLLEEGAANPALSAYFDALPATTGAEVEVDDFDTSALLPADHRSFRYTGSLTTPPCTEGVSWFVLTTPVQASAEQLAAFRTVVAENDRPVQPLGGRELLVDAD